MGGGRVRRRKSPGAAALQRRGPVASRKRLLSSWGPVRARSAGTASAIAADPEPAKGAPGRKDTRSWCRGKPGVPHQPVIIIGKGDTGHSCEWVPENDYRLLRRGEDGWSVGWLCWHREECSRCGRILRERWQVGAAECPDCPGDPEQRAEAEREAAAYPEQWRAWAQRHGRPKPVIDGKQGYRRKRKSA